MVKYGKLYRELQIKEFQGNYIDYKKLKQKIKKMQEKLPRTSQNILTKLRNSNVPSIKMDIRPSFSDEDYSRNSSTAVSYWDKYGLDLKEFKELLDKEFQRCYQFFKKIRKQLHRKINAHLYTQTKYSSYNKNDIIKEMVDLRKTMYLAKCLNAFINDNMMAIKKILKKFDKKFSNYFGNIGPKYILDNLIMENSDLEYLLQFKIIDETSCIIESNVKLLRDYFLELNDNKQRNNTDNNNFYKNYYDILEYIKDIDELIYFKIQYKEWFYFRKKDKIVNTKSNLYKNLMFNPILFSAYNKDDLMHKFLSRKQQINEVDEMQIPLSFKNKINILLIFVHTFFYNTLISGIYPLLFIIIRQLNIEEGINIEENEIYKDISYSFLIITSTYFSIYFSIMFYYCFGIKRIKWAYTISYILSFIGSLLFIFSYQKDLKDKNKAENKRFTIGLLCASRIIIGLGVNPTMGKNYILSYSSKYFLPWFSKIYVLITILGHSFGPFIEFILYSEDSKPSKIFSHFYYSNYNCIGWYGTISSLFFMAIHIILFTSPTSKGFHKLKIKNSQENKDNSQKENHFLLDDIEDSQDKEFYKLQKEMKNKVSLDIKEEEEDNNSINSTKINSKLFNKAQDKNEKLIETDLPIVKTSTYDDFKNIDINGLDSKYDVNPNVVLNQNNQDENYLENDIENGSFININMIPRTIEDLIRKEKTKLSYLNRNLLTIFIILFFNNLVKENFIAYCTYYISQYFHDSENERFIKLFEPKYFCCLISVSYLLEIISMFFIFPLYKINTLIKKLLVILMLCTLVLMVPLLFTVNIIKLYGYFIIISLVILLSSIIEVLSSCYLAYLTPPIWRFSQINAGVLPLYIMTFGKICGCLICLTTFIKKKYLNNIVVFISTFIGYGISGFYMIKSKNFRIKAIARIMRKSELESNVF